MSQTLAWSRLLPADVAVAASTLGVDDGSTYDVELAAAAGMAPGRRAEFRCGRSLAREALARLGRPATAVAVGASREPLWPAGVVGSITHCPGLTTAAVASADVLGGLGIDAEPAHDLPVEVREVVATTGELAAAARLGLPDRLLFGAKEAVFKAWFPATHAWLDLLDVRIEVSAEGRFAVVPAAPRLLGTAAGRWLAGLSGRWARSADHLLCAATSSTPSP